MNGATGDEGIPLRTPFSFTANKDTYEHLLTNILDNTAYFQNISYLFSNYDERLWQTDNLTRILFSHSDYEPQAFTSHAQETAEQLRSLSDILVAYNVENMLPDQIEDWLPEDDEYIYENFPDFHRRLSSRTTIRGNLIEDIQQFSEQQIISESSVQLFNNTDLRFLISSVYELSRQISSVANQYESEVVERGLFFPDGGKSSFTIWLSGNAMLLLGVCAIAMYAIGIPIPPQLAFGLPLILTGFEKIMHSGYVSRQTIWGSPPIQPIERRDLSAKLGSKVGIVPTGISNLEILERYSCWGFPEMAQNPEYLAIYVGRPISSVKYLGEVKSIFDPSLLNSSNPIRDFPCFDQNGKLIEFLKGSIYELKDSIPYQDMAITGPRYVEMRDLVSATSTADLV